MSQELLEELNELGRHEEVLQNKKELLKIRLKINQYEEASEKLDVQGKEQNKLKKRSLRYAFDKEVKRRKLNAIDDIRAPGTTGTLGENLSALSCGVFDTADKKYFGFLSRNGIIDLSSSYRGSQLHELGKKWRTYLIKNYKQIDIVDIKSTELSRIPKEITKVTDNMKAVACYNTIDIMPTNNDQERKIKNIYRHILDLHAFKSHMLSEKYLEKCSETSIIAKYWCSLFESYFGSEPRKFLQWGETMSVACQEDNMKVKLDLRISADDVESSITEFASQYTTTESKFFKDKLKSVLVTKCHLNKILKTLPFIPQCKAANIQIPIIQIMGINCSIYSFSIIDKKIYCIQDVLDFSIPRTYSDLRKNGIEKVLKGFKQVKHMLDNLDEVVNEYSKNPKNKMKKASRKPRRSSVQFVGKEWWSNVEWDTDINDTADSDGEDGGEEDYESDV